MSEPTIREVLDALMNRDNLLSSGRLLNPAVELAERVEAVLLRHKPSGLARPVDQDVCSGRSDEASEAQA